MQSRTGVGKAGLSERRAGMSLCHRKGKKGATTETATATRQDRSATSPASPQLSSSRPPRPALPGSCLGLGRRPLVTNVFGVCMSCGVAASSWFSSSSAPSREGRLFSPCFQPGDAVGRRRPRLQDAGEEDGQAHVQDAGGGRAHVQDAGGRRAAQARVREKKCAWCKSIRFLDKHRAAFQLVDDSKKATVQAQSLAQKDKFLLGMSWLGKAHRGKEVMLGCVACHALKEKRLTNPFASFAIPATRLFASAGKPHNLLRHAETAVHACAVSKFLNDDAAGAPWPK